MSGPKNPRDPALKAQRAARDRLLRQERQARARAESVAVSSGVAETVALSRARGQAIAEPTAGTREPYRRQTGLQWLAAKGRIDAALLAAGERYGWAYRRVKLEKAIPSTLDVRVRGEFMPPALADVLASGEATEQARRVLADYRHRLYRQADLVGVCDKICGEEQTPREASADERGAGRLEAVLKVALDILATQKG